MGFVIRFFRDVPRISDQGIECGFKEKIWYPGLNDYAQIPERSFPTVEEAAKHRKLSGDIVCEKETGFPCLSRKWLWDFEHDDPNCYARRMQKFSLKALGLVI